MSENKKKHVNLILANDFYAELKQTPANEWISNFTPHFKMDVIAYPCWD